MSRKERLFLFVVCSLLVVVAGGILRISDLQRMSHIAVLTGEFQEFWAKLVFISVIAALVGLGGCAFVLAEMFILTTIRLWDLISDRIGWLKEKRAVKRLEKIDKRYNPD